MADTSPDKIKKVLEAGVEEIIEKDHLKEKLKSGEELRVKLGIDPTAPDLHLGHTVVLRKLKQFQDLGHKAILIIGDFTAQIGDPSGRDKTRPTLSEKEIKENKKEYLKQAGKVIDVDKAEIRHNSEWLGKGLSKLIQITQAVSIQQVLRRSDFRKRIEENKDITMLETMYPVLQGYDSVAVEADVELGGTDQKFNLLMGRRVQRYFDMEEQDTVTVPLIEGTDGTKKMSKSLGNYIGLEEAPSEMFGKIMSVPDKLIDKYFELLTNTKRKNKEPYKAKLNLAQEIVSIYHSEQKAQKAKNEFEKVFKQGENPEDMLEIEIENKKIDIVDLLVKTGIESKSQAKRLIKQGGVSLNDKKIKNFTEEVDLKNGDVLQIGKKRFYEISTK